MEKYLFFFTTVVAVIGFLSLFVGDVPKEFGVAFVFIGTIGILATSCVQFLRQQPTNVIYRPISSEKPMICLRKNPGRRPCKNFHKILSASTTGCFMPTLFALSVLWICDSGQLLI